MGTTLENGVYLPSEGERNCYAGLKTNWEILDQKVADVTALQQAVAGALHRQIVASLPTTDIDPNTIYMILSGTSATENVYNEFMYVNNAWELIGTSATDLTNYYTKAEVDGKLLLKASASDLTSHTGDTTIHVTASDKTKWTNSAKAVVFRYSSTALTDSSTNSNALLDNADNLKVGDKVIDSSGVLFSITAIDTQNSTFTIGTALIDLAQDSDVVHKSGNETVGGVKTFADTPVFSSFDGIRFGCAHNSNAYITFRNTNQANPGSIILSAHDGNTGTAIHLVDKTLIPYNNNNDTDLGSSSRSWKDFYSYHGYFRGQQQGDEFSGNARTNLTLTANRDTLGQSGCLIDTFRENTSQGTGSHILGFGIKENSVRYEGCRLSWFYDNNNNGYVFALRPTNQGSNQPIKYELGTSSVKWSTINGLEPSSLGMPDLSNGIDISSYLTTGSSDNTYTPPANGFVSVSIGIASGGCAVFLSQGNMYNACYSATGVPNTSGITACCMLPVIGGVQMNIGLKGSNNYINSAKFFPCLGNV